MQIVSVSSWRLPHWLFAVTTAVYLTVWAGVLLTIGDVVSKIVKMMFG